MGTPSGFAFFLDPDVNAMLKKVLNAWAEYLSSLAATYVLGDDSTGRFSSHCTEDLAATANIGQTSYSFDDLIQCDPSKEHRSFKSWDHFFTRHFHEDKRPVASPDDDRVIANACESKPYNVAKNVSTRDKFWMKGQAYSVVDMLAHDPLYEHFVGGTIYQAFLSALSYHRWHAPVSGTVRRPGSSRGRTSPNRCSKALVTLTATRSTRAGRAMDRAISLQQQRALLSSSRPTTRIWVCQTSVSWESA